MLKINKFFFIITLSIASFVSAAPKNKIKMYALYTPSHEILVSKYFKKSIKDDFDLKVTIFDQKCATGEFNSDGWTKTMQDKVQVIINAIKENFGKIFIFSDVDIIFIKPVEKAIRKLMKNKDFIIQRSSLESNFMCTGFFAMRGNEQNLNLWIAIKEYMKLNPKLSEENVINLFMKQNKLNNIRWKFLPIEFYNGGMLTNKKWTPGQDLVIPKNILLHHANWTVGIENKIAQFEYVLKHHKN